jgi:DNA adenine methylase
VSYPGSKAANGVWHRIIGQMPPHSIYVEAFFGSGQVFHRKRPAKQSILIDRNPRCVEKITQTPAVRPLLGKAQDLLPTIYLPADAVVYCDPPYLLDTRQGRLYYGDFEMSDEDHSALLSTLKALKCRVLLSGYPHALYDDTLKDWRCLRYRTRTRGKTVTECLWCNFPEPDLLHDWRFAGRNFRDRWRLTKLKRNVLGKLARMNLRQRGFVLNAITEAYELR